MEQTTEQPTSVLAPLEEACTAITTEMSQDDVLGLYEKVQGVKQRLKEIDSALKEALIEWINANGEIQNGDNRFYVGTKRTTKLKDKAAAVLAIIERSGGDLGALAELLASEPIKQGAVKKQFGEELWTELFAVTEVPDLKTRKPVKELKIANDRFKRG